VIDSEEIRMLEKAAYQAGHADAAKDNPMRGIEMTFAYERAVGIIESSCLVVEQADEFQDGWYDLDSVDTNIDIEDEVRYLDSRRLLLHHPEHPRWVVLCDEGEPIEEAA